AEDGIRDGHVTGVQTCALPIWRLATNSGHGSPWKDPGRSGTWERWITGRADRERFWNEADCLEPEHDARVRQSCGRNLSFQGPRSEERRVGKECRSQWATYQEK